MKKCSTCGYEGESKFCPECGTVMEEQLKEKICPICGTKTESKFCPECGNNMSENKEIPNQQSSTDKTKSQINIIKKPIDIKTLIIIVLAVVVIALAVFAVVKSVKKDSSASTSTEKNITEEAITEKGKDVEKAQSQGLDLPGGKYIIGEDLPAGKYLLKYTTAMAETDYWSNDYFWITRAGSEGTQKTLGGTKYDERFGDVKYADAVAGKTFFANLKDGDVIVVDADYGNWSY